MKKTLCTECVHITGYVAQDDDTAMCMYFAYVEDYNPVTGEDYVQGTEDCLSMRQVGIFEHSETWLSKPKCGPEARYFEQKEVEE